MDHPILIHNRVTVWRESSAQRYIRIEHAVLVKIDDAEKVRFANLALCRRHLIAQYPQQRGLTAPVGTNQAHALSHRKNKIHPCKKGAAANLVAHSLKFNEPLGFAAR